jgi:hypothetical protein
LSLCPWTKKFSCPFDPQQGQEQKSRDKLFCPKRPGTKSPSKKKQEKDVLKEEKDILKQEKDVLKQIKDILKQERKF